MPSDFIKIEGVDEPAGNVANALAIGVLTDAPLPPKSQITAPRKQTTAAKLREIQKHAQSNGDTMSVRDVLDDTKKPLELLADPEGSNGSFVAARLRELYANDGGHQTSSKRKETSDDSISLPKPASTPVPPTSNSALSSEEPLFSDGPSAPGVPTSSDAVIEDLPDEEELPELTDLDYLEHDDVSAAFHGLRYSKTPLK